MKKDKVINRVLSVFFVVLSLAWIYPMFMIALNSFKQESAISTTTAFSATLSCFNNVGPGLSLVGPTRNFALFSTASKVVLIFDMLAGRLELFPMLALLVPSTWKD